MFLETPCTISAEPYWRGVGDGNGRIGGVSGRFLLFEGVLYSEYVCFRWGHQQIWLIWYFLTSQNLGQGAVEIVHRIQMMFWGVREVGCRVSVKGGPLHTHNWGS